MKKFVLLLVVIVCLISDSAFAAYDFNTSDRAEGEKVDALNRKMSVLVKDIEALTAKIASYNQPVLETRLTRKEREYYDDWEGVKAISPVMWNRVWAKGKTLMFGEAERNKKFHAVFFATNDPEIVFSEGVRVGADIKTLERFLGDSAANTGFADGNKIVVAGPFMAAGDLFAGVCITCSNGVISEISYYGNNPVVVSSKKALDFANGKARQMGLSTFGVTIMSYLYE